MRKHTIFIAISCFMVLIICGCASAAAPVSNFTANATEDISPLSVQFTDTSTGNPTSWSWDFGDGTNSNEQNPTHTYYALGNYTVTHTVINSDGIDTKSVDNYITVSTGELPSNRHIFISVSNSEGAKYDDGEVFGGPNGTYYIKADGGGLNQLHITTDVNNAGGQVNAIETTNTSSSGVFYITTTGGRGYNDEIILLVSVKGPISDDFSLQIISSGYNWTVTGSYPALLNYVSGAVNETFTKNDFLYGPHVFKPGPGTIGVWTLPLYNGQDTSDPSTAEYLMFVDLYVGNIDNAEIDHGDAKVEFNFTGLNSIAAFNAYAWCGGSNQGQGISWANKDNSGYTVTFVDVTAPTVTANPVGGIYNTAQSVVLTANDETATTIYYTTDGSEPTSSSTQYTTPIDITTTTTLKFMAIDAAGNQGTTQTETYTIDTTAPTVTATPVGGNYNTAQTVTLTANDETTTTIYYTTDGSEPTTTSTQYTTPINITTTTTLKFMAIDAAGNQGTTQTETYTIDTTAPTVTASPVGGNYNTAQTVTLTANDETTTTIYYTTDGSEPTSSSTQYTTPIDITTTTTLKFMAIDAAGNQGTTQIETYNIGSDVYVQITPSITNPTVGDQVTYTFKLGNNGPGDASNIVFTYVIPEGVEYAGANVDQGTVNYDETTRTITWTVGNVAAGVDPYLWLNLNILSAGTFNILPTITLDTYNPRLTSNIQNLQVNAATATTATTNTVNAATTNTVKAGSVPMQSTGAPLAGLILGILCIGSGITISRKK